MIESDICKKLECEKPANFWHSEIETNNPVEGYCSFDCMITDLRKLKCPVCDALMEFNSETAFFTCSGCEQRLRW